MNWELGMRWKGMREKGMEYKRVRVKILLQKMEETSILRKWDGMRKDRAEGQIIICRKSGFKERKKKASTLETISLSPLSIISFSLL